jgi:hypothetical protein
MKATLLFLVIMAGAVSAGQDTAITVSGTIKLKGDAPKSKPIKIRCPNCAPLYPDGMPREDLVVDKENRVQWAFVYVKAGLEGKKFDVPKMPVLLDQKGCRYEPHVLGIMAGQDFMIRNSDPHAHCFHAIPFVNKEFLGHHEKAGMETKKQFERPEVMVKIKDDRDVWMGAWVGVLDHPYFAVTGPDGKYEIKGLPAGKYTLEVWQERCALVTQEIEVKEKEARSLDFTLELKKE